MSFGARALIRLGAIQHNFKLLKDKAHGARVMAVIKANAYGHGMIRVAKALSDADCFAVARLAEAIELRTGGIETPIALLGGVFSKDDLAQAIQLELQIGVHTEPQLKWLEKFGEGHATVWLKIDTGMHRLGFRVDEAQEMINRLRTCPAVNSFGVMTHFSNADDVTDDKTSLQIQAFAKVISEFGGDVSVANSAGILGWDKQLEIFDWRENVGKLWVRPGIALYGISPFPDLCGHDLGLEPAMRLEAGLIAVKQLKKGQVVGYGGTWQAERDTTLGIVSAGYGDGYTRFIPAGTPVLVNERSAFVAGLVSMDLTAVDLGPDATDRVGDPVVLWGDDLPVEVVAKRAGTIPYQLLCGITNREESKFVD